MLWEEHGNVEYNTKTEQPVCNVRGPRACAKGPMRDGMGPGRCKSECTSEPIRWYGMDGRGIRPSGAAPMGSRAAHSLLQSVNYRFHAIFLV
jgi:hypothetical protein